MWVLAFYFWLRTALTSLKMIPGIWNASGKQGSLAKRNFSVIQTSSKAVLMSVQISFLGSSTGRTNLYNCPSPPARTDNCLVSLGKGRQLLVIRPWELAVWWMWYWHWALFADSSIPSSWLQEFGWGTGRETRLKAQGAAGLLQESHRYGCFKIWTLGVNSRNPALGHSRGHKNSLSELLCKCSLSPIYHFWGTFQHGSCLVASFITCTFQFLSPPFLCALPSFLILKSDSCDDLSHSLLLWSLCSYFSGESSPQLYHNPVSRIFHLF